MAKGLVIIESPGKAKAIQKYLGKGFIVEASFGHVKDLPKSTLGVDIDNAFETEYVVIPDIERGAENVPGCTNVFAVTVRVD